MVIRQGDIYWVNLPEPSGSEPGFLRPFVVVQNNLVNQSRIGTVVVCALTTNLKRAEAPGNVLLEDGEAGLPKRSLVNVTQLVTVDKRALGDYVGALSAHRIRQILDGIALVLEPREAETAS
jgi:mRNA interferase MazF